MSASLDMSLDDIILQNKASSGRHVNRNISRPALKPQGLGPGPDRRPSHRYPHRPGPYTMPAPTMRLPELEVVGGGGFGGGTETKLYISNLDYGVSSEDIQVLFSEVGDLIRHSIHYDKSGRSKGTAEVMFARQADALSAIRRYNNVQLDGKPMKIELVGVNAIVSPPTPVPPFGATRNTRQFNGPFRSPHPRTDVRGRGRGRGRVFGGSNARGFTQDQRNGRSGVEEVTAEALDLELEKYHLEAMKLN